MSIADRILNEKIGGIGKDFRYALRSLARSRGFTTVAVLSLAIGIGVNTAVFTGIHAVWLEPVPGVSAPDRMTEIAILENGEERLHWTFPDFLAVRDSETPIRTVAAWQNGSATLGTTEGGHRVALSYVTSDYFRVVGVAPSLGRVFLGTEDIRGEHPVIVVSHDTWINRLGGDPDIVGKATRLSGVPYTVVGVVPEEFRGTSPNHSNTDIWLPMSQNPYVESPNDYREDRETAWIRVLGRLRDGATRGEANTALQTIFTRLASEYPETNEHRGVNAATFGRFPPQNRLGDQLAVGSLAGLLVLFLMIICANLAGMVLARSAVRERELALRLALGASRGRLIRQLMIESLVVAVAGGGLGVLVSFWGMEAVSPSTIGIVAPGASFAPKASILAISAALALSTTLVFGLFPALRFSRPELVSALKDDVGGGGWRVGRIHRFAVASQTGAAMLALVVGSLFMRSVGVMDRMPLGYAPEDLIVAPLSLSGDEYSTLKDGGGELLDRMGAALSVIPGITSVSFATGIPLDGNGQSTFASRADEPLETAEQVRVEFTRATEGYFETIGAPILEGRAFQATDDERSTAVAVIAKSLADRLWPGQNPLGMPLRWPGHPENRELRVVGVVGDVAASRVTEDTPHVFIPLRQDYLPYVKIVLRHATDRSTLVGPIRAAVTSVDPQLPTPVMVTADSLIRRSRQGQMGIVRSAGGLGLLALLLSAIGVYGVVALTVAHRTREIGVRIALGATPKRVLTSVLREAVRLSMPGLVVGTALGITMGFALQSQLIGLSPLDPAASVAAIALLLTVVMVASLWPARRASIINPVDALRSE